MGNSADDKPKSKRDQQKNRSSGKVHPGGPHAHPELTDPDKTPGSGMFPSNGDDDGAGAPPSG
jgi:hypothetical protein